MSYSNPYFSGSSQAVSSPNVGLQYLWDGGLNNNNGGWRPITTGDLLTVTLEGAQVNVNLKKDEDTVNIYTDQGQEIEVAQTGNPDNFKSEVYQPDHNELNANVFQTGDPDNFNVNANLQIDDADVSVSNPINTQLVCPVLSNDENPASTAASFNGNADIDNATETYSLVANTRGTAGNKTVNGDGSSSMSTLASSNDFSINGGSGSLIPDNNESIVFTGGADAVKASRQLSGINYQAQVAGSAGNNITITVVDLGSESIAVNNNAITIGIDSGTTTQQEVVDLITNSSAANALVSASCGLSCANSALEHASSNLQNGDDGEFATFSGAVDVESKLLPVEITADSEGSSGNVTLTGNDTSTITQLVNTHNAGAGNAQLTVVSGGSYILNNGETITLTGGTDTESTAQEFYDSNNNFYYTKHSYVIKFSGTGNTASADVTFLVKNDGINDFASIKNETITWNPSTEGDQYLTYFDEFNFSSAKVSFLLTNCTAYIAETHTG